MDMPEQKSKTQLQLTKNILLNCLSLLKWPILAVSVSFQNSFILDHWVNLWAHRCYALFRHERLSKPCERRRCPWKFRCNVPQIYHSTNHFPLTLAKWFCNRVVRVYSNFILLELFFFSCFSKMLHRIAHYMHCIYFGIRKQLFLSSMRVSV